MSDTRDGAGGVVDRYLGVDLGGSKIAVSLWEVAGAASGAEAEPLLREKVRWDTLPGGPEANLDRILSAGARMLQGREARAVGISGGGPLDAERGVILSIPNLAGWVDVPIAAILSEGLGAPVHLENDANACAVAEWLYGAGRGATSLAFLTCSTGIGAGLVLDGRLYRGSRGLAGEVGHQVIVPDGLPCGCGGRGCLEAYASGTGIARRLRALGAGREDLPRDARDLVARARSGDAFSLCFLRETAELLALGLAQLIFTLNPDRIVLGTIAVGAGPLLLDPLDEALRRLVWPSLLEGLRVVPAALGDLLGDHAALAVARDIPRLR